MFKLLEQSNLVLTTPRTRQGTVGWYDQLLGFLSGVAIENEVGASSGTSTWRMSVFLRSYSKLPDFTICPFKEVIFGID